jgi:hypothetical protein
VGAPEDVAGDVAQAACLDVRDHDEDKSAKTTLDTYGHLWPDSDDSTRAAVDDVIATKVNRVADYVRTSGELS